MANTSHHLQLLSRAGLVRFRREGTRVIYRLASERVGELWSALRDVAAEHVAEVEVWPPYIWVTEPAWNSFRRRSSTSACLMGGLWFSTCARVASSRQGTSMVPARLPFSELRDLLDHLPAMAEFVVYCRSPFCVYADQAVQLLQARGFIARRLDSGFPEWRRAGLPVAASAR